MTVIVQDDHLTAGAWAACGPTEFRKNSLKWTRCNKVSGQTTSEAL